MPASNFRFVSPGVYTNEIDNSKLPRLPARMGPVIIGRSLRGPLMKPVQVQSFADFIDVFGEPVAGGVGGDVWRDGNKTAPTYGAYAAQAYLRNANPITFIRLGGYENDQKLTEGRAGWDLGGDAYGLFVAPITGSDGDYTIDAMTGTLAAIIYTTSTGSSQVGLSGPELTGSAESHKETGVWIRSTGADAEFKLVVGDVSASVNFNENSKKYIRNVLNVNPILTNASLIKEENRETYFLGESYATAIKKVNAGVLSTGADQLAGVLVKLGAGGAADFADHKRSATHAESGWVVSQHKGQPADFIADPTTGLYPVQKLFKLVSLSEGEWNSQNLKISIEDVREPSNNYTKFGTFTVSVRYLNDSDAVPAYVERFANLSLDINSENYIAKRIGDKYRTWDYVKKEFVEYGTYDNLSKFIRVEMDEDAASGLNDTDLLPFGFYGPVTYKAVDGSGTSMSAARFIGETITSTNIFDVSLELPSAIPNVSLLGSSTDSIASSFQTLFWGLKTSVLTTKKHNKDTGDLLKELPAEFPTTVGTDTKYAYFFSLDDVSGTVNNKGVLVETSGATWQEGYRSSLDSVTAYAYDNGLTGSRGASVILSKFNKFTMPLYGGSDGVDITEKDPFNKRVLDTEANEFNNYAYNSVKVAVESIADPEVVEMNLACMPAIENESLTNLLMEKCETRADALAIIDLPGDYTPDEAKASPTQSVSARKPDVDAVIANLKSRNLNTSYGCTFFPWVMIQDSTSGNSVWIPSSVAALGTFAFSERASELWFAPAGFNRGGLSSGAAGLTVLQTALKINSKDRDALYEANINPIASFPAEGIVIFGQKTLQVTPSALDRINVRRLMIYLKKEISRFAATVLFDPNIEVTWKRFTSIAGPFLESVKVRFGLSDYRLVLDTTTTTPDLVDRNIVYAKVLLKPTRAIEFIGLDFVITNTGASFND